MTDLSRTITRRHLMALAGAAAAGKFYPPFADAMAQEKTASSSTLFFKSAKADQWDTWVYYHNDTFYLYYQMGPFDQWDGFGLAMSRDGVHWQDHGKVVETTPGCGSGSVWPAIDGTGRTKKFIMNFAEFSKEEDREWTFFAESEDLIHWTRLGPQYEFRQDTRWYEPKGRWSNIWAIPRQGGGYYGYWAATPKEKKLGLGFGESLDGITWRALPPPELPGVRRH